MFTFLGFVKIFAQKRITKFLKLIITILGNTTSIKRSKSTLKRIKNFFM